MQILQVWKGVFCLWVLLLAQFSCSVDENIAGQTVKLKVLGVFERPDGAIGEFEPISQTYTFEEINFIGTDGTILPLLTSGDKTIQIANRNSLVFEKTLTDDFVGLGFASMQVIVNPAVTGTSKFSSEHSLTLEVTEITYPESFVVSKGKSLVFTVLVRWRGTVSRDQAARLDVMSNPNFRMTLTES